MKKAQVFAAVMATMVAFSGLYAAEKPPSTQRRCKDKSGPLQILIILQQPCFFMPAADPSAACVQN